MPLTFYAIDEEFAAATGSNVGVSSTESIFDNPPNAFRDLEITVNDGDTDPRHFEVGDTYDLTWGGHGGGGSIEDAEVVRSDMAPGGGGVIVLRGIDDQGDPAEIIWTPDFNLEEWYWDHYNPSAEPQFYTTDTDADYSHEFVCFAEETHIATAMGGVPVGDLWDGDMIETLDHGAARITQIMRRRVSGKGSNAPVMFAPGTIGNHAPLRLNQQHRVLLRTPLAEMMFATNEVLVPAKALIDGHLVRLSPCDQVTYVHILLERHEILFAEGAECESLLLGDMALRLVADQAPKVAGPPMRAARPVLSYSEACVLVSAMSGKKAGIASLAACA